VKATAYVQPSRTLVAMASWAKEPVEVVPQVAWSELGIDPTRAVLRAHAIDDFQEARTFRPGEPVPMVPGRGWLLEVRALE